MRAGTMDTTGIHFGGAAPGIAMQPLSPRFQSTPTGRRRVSLFAAGAEDKCCSSYDGSSSATHSGSQALTPALLQPQPLQHQASAQRRHSNVLGGRTSVHVEESPGDIRSPRQALGIGRSHCHLSPHRTTASLSGRASSSMSGAVAQAHPPERRLSVLGSARAPGGAFATAAAAAAATDGSAVATGSSSSSRFRNAVTRASPSSWRTVHPLDHSQSATSTDASAPGSPHPQKQQQNQQQDDFKTSSHANGQLARMSAASPLSNGEAGRAHKTASSVASDGDEDIEDDVVGEGDVQLVYNGKHRITADGHRGSKGDMRDAAVSKEERQQALTSRAEVYERYGPWFEELRGAHALTLWFALAVVLNAAMPAVLLGAQKGQNIQPGSTAAKAMNLSLLGVKAAYALLLTCLWPYRSWMVLMVEVGA